MLIYMKIKEKITLSYLTESKKAGNKFSVLTCYDARTAALMESAGVEVLLVGDTAAEVILGLPTTREIPPEFLLNLTAAVRRGAPNVFLMGDLPYACRPNHDLNAAIEWSIRCCNQAGSDAVKVEVTGQDAPLVQSMTDAGIPIVAHLGLLPQMIDPETGYRARGKDADNAMQLMEDAQTLEKAGAVMLLLEAVASEVAKEIAQRTTLPVVGCVAGPHCDGTVVVLQDMLGWGGGHPPRFVKRYENVVERFSRAFSDYVEDIHTGRFPQEEKSIHMLRGEYEKLLAKIGKA